MARIIRKPPSERSEFADSGPRYAPKHLDPFHYPHPIPSPAFAPGFFISGGTPMITAAQIKKLFPSAKPDLVAAIVTGWPKAEAADIATLKRKALFLAMIGVETGGLRAIVENLNYTSAGRIRETWPSRFKSDTAAKPYVRQPEKLANFVYGSRLGNRGTASGDGWRFRGGGMMQTTGRENYGKRGRLLGLPLEDRPELLRDPATAFAAAVAEWSVRGCNALADAGRVRECRRAINGGTIGLDEAAGFYAKALVIFAGEKARPSVAPLGFAALPVSEDHADAGFAADVDAPSEDLVRFVQGLLRDKGYPEVGNIDGDPSGRTAAAILAFQNDNGHDLTGKVTPELVAQLVAAPVRSVSAARATATAKDLADAPSVGLMQKLKTAAYGALGIGVGGTGLNVEDALQRAESIRDAVMRIGPWIILIVGGAVVVFFAGRFIREQVIAYREGRHV